MSLAAYHRLQNQPAFQVIASMILLTISELLVGAFIPVIGRLLGLLAGILLLTLVLHFRFKWVLWGLLIPVILLIVLLIVGFVAITAIGG